MMLNLKLLGHFELTGPAGRIALSSTRLSAFLAYLALEKFNPAFFKQAIITIT